MPSYELALMTAERARLAGVCGLELVLITPEPFPWPLSAARPGRWWLGA